MADTLEIKAEQVIYTNVEEDLSTNRFRGFQLWQRSPGINDSTYREISEVLGSGTTTYTLSDLQREIRKGANYKIFYEKSGTIYIPTDLQKTGKGKDGTIKGGREVFFHKEISGDRIVIARAIDLTRTDIFGRKGRATGHAVIIDKEDFAKIGNDPTQIFNRVQFYGEPYEDPRYVQDRKIIKRPQENDLEQITLKLEPREQSQTAPELEEDPVPDEVLPEVAEQDGPVFNGEEDDDFKLNLDDESSLEPEEESDLALRDDFDSWPGLNDDDSSLERDGFAGWDEEEELTSEPGKNHAQEIIEQSDGLRYRVWQKNEDGVFEKVEEVEEVEEGEEIRVATTRNLRDFVVKKLKDVNYRNPTKLEEVAEVNGVSIYNLKDFIKAKLPNTRDKLKLEPDNFRLYCKKDEEPPLTLHYYGEKDSEAAAGIKKLLVKLGMVSNHFNPEKKFTEFKLDNPKLALDFFQAVSEKQAEIKRAKTEAAAKMP